MRPRIQSYVLDKERKLVGFLRNYTDSDAIVELRSGKKGWSALTSIPLDEFTLWGMAPEVGSVVRRKEAQKTYTIVDFIVGDNQVLLSDHTTVFIPEFLDEWEMGEDGDFMQSLLRSASQIPQTPHSTRRFSP